MEQERILCAAIWYPFIDMHKDIDESLRLPLNIDRGLVFCGFRHCHCMYTMVAVTGKRSIPAEVGEIHQGFLTNKNRFVDREEAAIIAHNAGQLQSGLPKELYSEDLY